MITVKSVTLEMLLDVMLGRADDPDTRAETVDVFLQYMCGERGGKRTATEVALCRIAIGHQYPWMHRIVEYPDEAGLAELVGLHGKSLLVRPLAGAYREKSEARMSISAHLAELLRESASTIAMLTNNMIPLVKREWDRPVNYRFNRSFLLGGETRRVSVSLHSFNNKGEGALTVVIDGERCVLQFTKQSVTLQAWLNADDAYPSLVNPGNLLIVLQDLADHFRA